MKQIDLIDYQATISFNENQHYPFTIILYDKYMSKELYVGQHVTIDQLCFQLHLQLLDYKECYLSPVKTLLMVEEVRNTLDMLVYEED